MATKTQNSASKPDGKNAGAMRSWLLIALVAALLGIIDTMLVGRYLENGRWQ